MPLYEHSITFSFETKARIVFRKRDDQKIYRKLGEMFMDLPVDDIVQRTGDDWDIVVEDEFDLRGQALAAWLSRNAKLVGVDSVEVEQDT